MAKLNKTIHEWLEEIKRFETLLNQRLSQAEFVYFKKNSEKKIFNKTITEVEAAYTGSFKAIDTIIKNLAIIKSAIFASNATTKIQFMDTEVTLAEMLAYEKMIFPKKELFLNRMKIQLAKAKEKVNVENVR